MNSERLNAVYGEKFPQFPPKIKEKIIDILAKIKIRRMDFIFK